MAKNEAAKKDEQKAQDYLELYHLLVRGMEMIGAFSNSTEEARRSSYGKQLERAYVLLRRDFLELRKKCTELEGNHPCIFIAIEMLGGSNTAERILDWASGVDVDFDENGEPHYSGTDMYVDELASISREAYLAGIENIEVEPKNMHYKKSYDLAYEAIKNIKAMSVSKYTLTWDEMNNEVILNGVYKIKSVYSGADSNTLKLLTKIKNVYATKESTEKGKEENGYKNDIEFDFEPSGTRTTAQTITDLGMTPILRKIFFPEGTRGNHIRFRSPVTKKMLKIEGVNLDKLFKEVDLKIVEAEIKNSREDIVT